MYSINEITIDHIGQLSPEQLSELLHILLKTEAKKNSLENWEILVPQKITVADGGEDGRIKWTGNPASTQWLKNKLTIFQNKATALIPSKCFEEILVTAVAGQPRRLKSQVEDIVANNGCYTLFTNQDLNTSQKEERVAEFRRAIQEANQPNYSTLEIRVYDANLIKDWTYENVAAVTFVQACVGISRPTNFRTWNEWETDMPGSQIPYQSNSILENNIRQIRSELKRDKVIRVIGHSGLGKTRMVLEAFRESTSDPEITAQQSQLVYYDIGFGSLESISGYLLSHRNHQSGIIVIDNCDENSHNTISGLVRSSGNFKVITVDFASETSERSVIKLDRENQKDVVQNIVEEEFKETLTKTDKEFIAKQSEGYPQMAILFSESVRGGGLIALNNQLPDDFLKKLVFGRNSQSDFEFEIIKACSVLSSFGFVDDNINSALGTNEKEILDKQTDYVRKKICGKIKGSEVSQKDFYKVCLKYKSTNIIEQRGTRIMVKPTPLAINLAALWWKETPHGYIREILSELANDELGKRLVERLTELDQLDKAKEIVNELWGPNSPFGTAEVLKTSLGSLLFRYVVEVNPISTTKTLEAAFGKYSIDQLLQIEEGRRNLVWALEKLVFRKETFGQATKMLFAFAAAENESWGNNATGQFRQLYQIFLPGTEANFEQRLEVIDWGLSKNEDAYTKVAIEALGRGLMNDHFSRGGGPEKQGSGAPLVDYKPENWGEIHSYWSNILNILTEIVCSSSLNSNLAKEKIQYAIRSLIRGGQIEIVSKSISKIVSTDGNYWPDALSSLKTTLHFDSPPEKVGIQINSLVELLSPKDLKNQLLLKVAKPEWDSYEKDEKGEYIDKPYLNAIAFAEKVVQQNQPWTDYLDELLKGEQRQTFSFGRRIGQLSTDVDKIIGKAIHVLKSIPPEMQNPELIGGLIVGYAKRDNFEKSVGKFIVEDSLRHHSFYLTRVFQPSLSDLTRLFELIDKYGVSIYSFLAFQYGRSLSNINESELIEFSKRLAGYDREGRWVALSILFMHCYGNDNNWKSCKDYLLELISGDNLLLNENNPNRLDYHHWSETVVKLLKESVDAAFALQVSKQIVEACSKSQLISLDSFASNVIRILVEKHFSEIWEIFGSGLLGDFITFFKLKNLLGSKRGWLGADGIIFDSDDRNQVILEWCAKYPTIAPKRMANMMPLEKKTGEQIDWHPFAKAIIDTYGDLDGLLEEISANMGTFGMTGSSIPYYKDQKELLLKIKGHPNLVVRDWVEKMIDYTERKIKREKLEEESDL